ncbi:Succinyl-CoA ligase [ADP-forming] subunit beta [Candidatus Jidaibacter acanthamoeba]|uniref:Succinate--CoA ligase [ADP-forming] subunit beta n=1 Tax=Candidatus Jidaibacter acanthamoebae TaxID=86105 RepID=A0A0C1MST6_9RICK|nr:ADP-forming succinate--CoA ligase subunit beta [Candidatus Jidaibacter acanthamoeba]KIE05137.1 Succinyl-CoA ligase [ADP-forming] subunit beta [Candidatus Jidaibacter acanthamoeba]
MNIHEYQAKQVLAKYGVSVPTGEAAFSVEEAVAAANKLIPADTKDKDSIWVVKAQIHAGGRGKAGGVKVVRTIEDVEAEAKRMLGMTLITKQTGPEGKMVRRLYIEKGSHIKKEYYLSLVLDRMTGGLVFIASTEGGVEIEEVAEAHPEKIVKVAVDPAYGIQDFHLRKIAFGLGFEGDKVKALSKLARSLYNAFIATDANQIEINPLIETTDGSILALDAKINFDANALYKHPEIAELRDEHEEDPLEVEAHKDDLNYIKMEGNIGCMVNGAGLAMATMDIIKLYGGSPANFLDVGGGATKEKVTKAFKLILSDKNVKGILVNIFGGIMRCDIIAEGVIHAAKEVGVQVPVVVRLAGTNADKGKEMLSSSGLALIPANDLADAAQKIVSAIK